MTTASGGVTTTSGPSDDLSGRSVIYGLLDQLTATDIVAETTTAELVFENDYYEPVEGIPVVVCEWEPGVIESTMDGNCRFEEGALKITTESDITGGATFANCLADEVHSRFNPTKEIKRSSWTIQILNVWRGVASRSDAWWTVPIGIRYKAWAVNS